MAVLLVAMSIMAIMITVAMPVWRQAAQREKEEELVFRGLQYTHAIGLFQKKYANAFPPTLDALVTERFLRKKYKDPITNDDFVPILQGQNVGGLQQQTQPGGRGGAGATTPGRGAAPSVGQSPTGTVGGGAQIGGRAGGVGGGPVGGIMGVTSKSKDKSIRLYNGRGHYNEWAFVFTPQVQAPGAGAPGAGAPGAIPGRGGPGGNSPFPGGVGPGGGNRGAGRGGGFGSGRGGTGAPPSRGGTPGTGTMNPFQPPTPSPPRGGRSGG
jgi:type II secretory pathway pseudopilin PulG